MRIYHYGEELTVYVFKAIIEIDCEDVNCLLVLENSHETGILNDWILFNHEIDELDDEDLYGDGTQFGDFDWESDWEALERLLVLEDFDGELMKPEKYSHFKDRYAW